MRLVAVGDSVSEGVGDPAREGLQGWVHHLARAADLVVVANLARTGATVAEVRRSQLERAVTAVPDVVTCVVGVNDVLRPGFDEGVFEEDYDHVLGALTAAAARGVLTMTLHDIGAGLPLRSAARVRLAGRIARANDVIERVSRRHGASVLDARDVPALRGAGMLSLDLLHPNRRGHRFLAYRAVAVLRDDGVLPPGPPPAVPEADPLPLRLAAHARHLRWIAGHVVRSTRRGPAPRPRG